MRPTKGECGRRSGQGAFTLIEMIVAVAIAAILVSAVYAALVSSATTARAQEGDSAKDAARAKVVELLMADLRGRTKYRIESAAADEDALVLSTTSDSLWGDESKRMGEELCYLSSPRGLSRREGTAGEVELVKEPVLFEYWHRGAWRKRPGGESRGIRLTFASPWERVVVR